MDYVKTELGAKAVKDRRTVELSRTQRSALILFDGQRSLRAVLDATAPLGVTVGDIDVLISKGLLASASGAADALPANAGLHAGPASGTPQPIRVRPPAAAAAQDDEERARRYRVAYPMAAQITAKLGQRGIQLNQAVEATTGFDGLVALLPGLRDAVGDASMRALEAALIGR